MGMMKALLRVDDKGCAPWRRLYSLAMMEDLFRVDDGGFTLASC